MKKKCFFNYPKLFSHSSYVDAKYSIIDKFEKSNDTLAIFEYGSLNNLGISDIDIMVILKNKVSSIFRVANLNF